MNTYHILGLRGSAKIAFWYHMYLSLQFKLSVPFVYWRSFSIALKGDRGNAEDNSSIVVSDKEECESHVPQHMQENGIRNDDKINSHVCILVSIFRVNTLSDCQHSAWKFWSISSFHSCFHNRKSASS